MRRWCFLFATAALVVGFFAVPSVRADDGAIQLLGTAPTTDGASVAAVPVRWGCGYGGYGYRSYSYRPYYGGYSYRPYYYGGYYRPYYGGYYGGYGYRPGFGVGFGFY